MAKQDQGHAEHEGHDHAPKAEHEGHDHDEHEGHDHAPKAEHEGHDHGAHDEHEGHGHAPKRALVPTSRAAETLSANYSPGRLQ